MKIILANGEIIEANPVTNSDLFYGVIGGYGGLGVISEVTLRLADNSKIQRTDKKLRLSDYHSFFSNSIIIDSSIIFHNADIYPKRFKKIRAVSYHKTEETLTIEHRLKPLDKKSAKVSVPSALLADGYTIASATLYVSLVV